MAPFFAMDAWYYRLEETVAGCFFNNNEQWTYAAFIEFGVYDLGYAVVVGAYPFLWYKRRQQRRRRVEPAAKTRRECKASSEGKEARSNKS